jgi:hypothetical protein
VDGFGYDVRRHTNLKTDGLLVELHCKFVRVAPCRGEKRTFYWIEV